MNRERLAAILARHEGEAFAACRRAVLAGARFWVARDPQPASTLLRTYARREKHTRQRGTETIGFVEAVTNWALWARSWSDSRQQTATTRPTTSCFS